MNATIEKIIGLLFEDIEENEETRAIHEELLTNCQERYDDLIRSGLSEDDAIHAVIESLNGMEALLEPYPRKAAEPEAVEPTNTKPCWELNPAQTPIREIRAGHLGSADVEVQTSEDALIHISCDRDDVTLMTGIEDGVLTIGLREGKKHEKFDFSGDFSFDLNDIGRMFEQLAQKFTSLIKNVRVRISVPQTLRPAMQLITSSGNIELEAAALESLTATTSSGDISLDSLTAAQSITLSSSSGDLEMEDVSAATATLHSASGDITLNECSIRSLVTVRSTSGDVECTADCQELKASAISGDLHLQVSAQSIQFSTVSGDVQLSAESKALHLLQGTTTSGDMQISLPHGLRACISSSTRSGDVHQRAASDPASPVRIDLTSISGDISVR